MATELINNWIEVQVCLKKYVLLAKLMEHSSESDGNLKVTISSGSLPAPQLVCASRKLNKKMSAGLVAVAKRLDNPNEMYIFVVEKTNNCQECARLRRALPCEHKPAKSKRMTLNIAATIQEERCIFEETERKDT